MTSFSNFILKNIGKKPVYHFLLWTIYAILIFFFYLYNSSGDDSFTIGNIVINLFIHLFFLIIIVYYNLHKLIPTFLQKKKILLYILALAFSAIVISPIEIVFTYFVVNHGLEDIKFEDINRLQIQNFGSLFFINIIVTISFIIKSWYIQDRIRRDLENKNLLSELSFLKSQINPHFLFNTLNSLYALSLKKSDNTPQLILQLSQMMRYMLYECNEKYVPLQKELDYIKNYLALEALRYGQKVNIIFDYHIDAIEKYEIAPLLFITFLENSFKHGISHQLEKGGDIVILLQVEDGHLDFNISNEKHLVTKPANYAGGIGLVNIQKRLALLYPKAHELSIIDEDDMYHIQLSLELNERVINP